MPLVSGCFIQGQSYKFKVEFGKEREGEVGLAAGKHSLQGLQIDCSLQASTSHLGAGRKHAAVPGQTVAQLAATGCNAW
jgi:hypothetical protein